MKNKKYIKIIVFILVVILILVFGCYLFFNKTNYGKNLKINWQQKKVLNEDKRVLKELGEILLLPDGVVPTMAIVTNADILKKQQGFFKDVKNGDRVIIYPEMAIIFDAKAEKIIKVGPVQTASLVDKEATQNKNASIKQ